MTAYESTSHHYSFSGEMRVVEIRGPYSDNEFVVEFKQVERHGDTVDVRLGLEEAQALAQELFVRTHQVLGTPGLAQPA